MTFSPLDLVRLHSGISGMTPTILRMVLQAVHNQQMTFADVFQMSVTDLRVHFGFTEKTAHALVASDTDKAENTLRQLQAKRFTIITFLDDAYPPQLKRFGGDKTPPLLYVFGNPAHLNTVGTGFGGARNVSSQGLQATDQLARSAVKDYHHTVISGHAKGVDEMAHQAALASGGTTILVLPEGALTFRLIESLRAFWSEASERIVVLSQFAPHEPWQARNAMIRNSTVIGLSQAFCVIEAGDEKGGTWQAGTTTLAMNMPLYVLDYETAPASALGNRKLIARGGIPIPHQQKLIFPSLNMLPPKPAQTADSTPVQPSLFNDA